MTEGYKLMSGLEKRTGELRREPVRARGTAQLQSVLHAAGCGLGSSLPEDFWMLIVYPGSRGNGERDKGGSPTGARCFCGGGVTERRSRLAPKTPAPKPAGGRRAVRGKCLVLPCSYSSPAIVSWLPFEGRPGLGARPARAAAGPHSHVPYCCQEPL